MDLIKDLDNIIIHRAQTVVKTFLQLGKNLNELKELCIQAKVSFEAHIKEKEEEFGFGIRQAQKYMQVYDKFGLETNLSSLGITKLYLLTYVPDEQIDEIIELVQDKKIDREELSRKVKRAVEQIGNTSRSDDPELTLKRQIETLFEEYEDVIKDFKESFANWIKTAEKYDDPELKTMKQKANEILERLK